MSITMLILSLILVSLFGALIWLSLATYRGRITKTDFIWGSYRISTLLLVLILLIIKSEYNELFVRLSIVITEMVEEILNHDYYYMEQLTLDLFSNTALSDAISEGSNPTTMIPDPIPCPCCEISSGGKCNCLGEYMLSGSHQLNPPFEGMDAEIRGNIDRICCKCGNAFDLRCCFACECVICDDCQTSSQPVRSDFADPDNSPIPEKENPDSFTFVDEGVADNSSTEGKSDSSSKEK